MLHGRVPEEPSQFVHARDGNRTAGRPEQTECRLGCDEAEHENDKGRCGASEEERDCSSGAASLSSQAVKSDEKGVEHRQQEKSRDRPILRARVE
jgi:hypothetical protein